MTWGRVDDALAFNPKVIQAGNEAMGVWVRCLSWCSQQLSDGHVPESIVELMQGRAGAEALVAAGLWHETPTGWVFHDWEDYQPTKQGVRDQQAKNRKRQQDWRDRTKADQGKRNGVTDESVTRDERVTNGAPSHPIPSHKERGAQAPSPAPEKSKRAQRLPEGWTPTADDVAWANKEAPGLNLERELEKFSDYWLGKAGRDAAKLDWSRTWRNWVRRAVDSMPGQASPRQARTTPAEDAYSAEMRERKAQWLAARGVTEEQYEKHKDEPGWLDSLEPKK